MSSKNTDSYQKMSQSRSEWLEAAKVAMSVEYPSIRKLLGMVRSPFVDLEVALSFPSQPTVWKVLSENPYINWVTVMDTLEEYPWIFSHLMKRDDAPLEFFTKNMYQESWWDWKAISMNPQIPFEVVQDNLDLPWNIPMFSTRSDQDDFPWDLVLEHPEWNWDWIELSQNVSPRILRKHTQLPWVYNQVDKLDVGLITDFPDYDWNYYRVYKKYPWDFHRIKQAVPESIRAQHSRFRLPWEDFSDLDPESDNLMSRGMLDVYSKFGIPWDLIAAHPTANWDLGLVLVHVRDVETYQIVRDIAVFDTPGAWDHYSWEFPLGEIMDNMDLPWFFNSVSGRDDFDQFDPQLILDNPQVGWNLGMVEKTFPEIMDQLMALNPLTEEEIRVMNKARFKGVR